MPVNDLASAPRCQIRSGAPIDRTIGACTSFSSPIHLLESWILRPNALAGTQTLAGRIRTELETSGLDAVVITIVSLTGPRSSVPEDTSAPRH